MENQRSIENEILGLESLQRLVETYQEIAAGRMRKVKDSVLKNREFLDGLNEIFQQVKYSHKKELERLLKKRKIKDLSELSLHKHNDKTVSVLLSANTMLYGDILRRTFKKFVTDVSMIDTDIVIVGKVGLQFYKASKMGKPYKFFDLSDSAMDAKNLKEIIDYVVQYERVSVYHCRFEDILTQVATQQYITGDIAEAVGMEEKAVPYIFEPTLEDVLVFFEVELLAAIFEQTVYESNLSKFTSRMISLDSAIDSIRNRLVEADFTRQRIKHRVMNKEQLASISGISLWGSA